MTWNADDPTGNEAAKVKWDIVPYTRGAVLDMGCGGWKAFAHFIGVDSGKDTLLFNHQFKADVTLDASDPATIADNFVAESVDAVFSSHMLEHVQDFKATLGAWWDLIKVGGHLVLYLPHRDLYPRMGQPGSNQDHKHDFVPEDIEAALQDLSWDLKVRDVRGDADEYSFLMVFEKLYQTPTLEQHLRSHESPKPPKTVCVVRYGGFGDMIQASNILPELKRQGYHVTVMTTPKGQDIIKHDPHVDGWLIQDTDQVRNEDLPAYWAAQSKRFDKFVQLSESVEGTLLAYPGRSNHAWPDEMRRKRLDDNYLEFTSEIAQLPYLSEARFYPSDDEQREVMARLTEIRHALDTARRPTAAAQIMAGGRLKATLPGPRFNILWALAGSSHHKFYPHQDDVLRQVLHRMPEAVVFFTGDVACKILEAGWEEEPRVRCLSGEIGIRQTLALAQAMDLVVGPETGVLNAVAFEPMGKVIMLSHSSAHNLTKHWVNTDTLEPSTACHPCHRLHFGHQFCADTPMGGAQCQWDIGPEQAYNAIARHYLEWKQLGEAMAPLRVGETA